MMGLVQAGMVTKLPARTSVLAAMNPVGQYDPMRSLEANTGLPPPLLSRFDIVLALVDGVHESRCADTPRASPAACRRVVEWSAMSQWLLRFRRALRRRPASVPPVLLVC